MTAERKMNYGIQISCAASSEVLSKWYVNLVNLLGLYRPFYLIDTLRCEKIIFPNS